MWSAVGQREASVRDCHEASALIQAIIGAGEMARCGNQGPATVLLLALPHAEKGDSLHE